VRSTTVEVTGNNWLEITDSTTYAGYVASITSTSGQELYNFGLADYPQTNKKQKFQVLNYWVGKTNSGVRSRIVTSIPADSTWKLNLPVVTEEKKLKNFSVCWESRTMAFLVAKLKGRWWPTRVRGWRI